MVVIIIQSIVEVKKINNYLDEYLKYIFNEKGIKEVKKVCKKIIKCKPVTGLNDYSKEILALAMEKRIIMSIEQNRQSRQSTSYWQHLKIAAPLIYQENNSLADYMDLVVKDLYIEVKRNKTLSEISDFYDQEIYNATKLFSNRLFSLPNGRKVSVRDLTIAISKTLNSESVLKKEYVIKQKTGNLKNTAAIAGLTTALAISMIFNQEKDKIELENANLIEKIDENKFYVNEYLIQSPENIESKSIEPIKTVFKGYDTCPIEYQEYMYEMAKKYDIPYNVFITIVDNESNGLFDTNGVISSWDDYGLCQINICNHDKIYKDLKFTSADLLNDPYKNIEASAYLIKQICNIYPEEVKNGQYQNIFGAYNGWILWKNKKTSVEYVSKAMEKIENIYNKTDEELYETVYEVENGKSR